MYDCMIPYQIAADEGEINVPEYLAQLASNLFPDQEAFFVRDVGTAHIIKGTPTRRTPDRAFVGQGKTLTAE